MTALTNSGGSAKADDYGFWQTLEKCADFEGNDLVPYGGLDQQDSLGNSFLHWTVYNGDYAATKLLLDYGVNPNLRTSFGLTPMSLAPNNDYVELLSKYGGTI